MPRTVAPVFRFGFANAVKTDRFPEKLYEVLADDYLIHWNHDGTSVFVDEIGFAEVVMECYPGFLQIPDFANLRRLFREYGFDWQSNNSTFEFSHPSFLKGRPELLGNVLTRRKSFYKCKSRNTTPNPLFKNQRDDLDDSEDEVDQPKEPGVMTRRGFIPYNKTKRPAEQKNRRDEKIKFDEKKAYKIHERPSLIKTPGNENKTEGTPVLEMEEDEETLKKCGFEENKRAIENIINVFAINELSPEEFLEYLELKRSKPISSDNSSSDISSTLLPILKSDNNEIQEFPFQYEFEQQDYTFTQIRPINYQLCSEDILQPKDYHMMETIVPINQENRVDSDINCTCSCHLVCSQ